MNKNDIIQTSDKWLKDDEFKNLIILDPDGWDRANFQYSFYEEQISLEEFRKRVYVSTIQWDIDKVFLRTT